MTTSQDQYDFDEAAQDGYPTLAAMDRDLERLGELTSAHVTDEKQDLGVAAARIPDEGLRREAEEILAHLKAAIGRLDGLTVPLPETGGGTHPA